MGSALWYSDFRGWFRTGEDQRRDPFTLIAAHSRYLLFRQAAARPDEQHGRPISNSCCEGQGGNNALIRRTPTRTSAPILRSFSRSEPHVGLANWVCASPIPRGAQSRTEEGGKPQVRFVGPHGCRGSAVGE
jgi:hypothetical protein